MCVPFKIRNTFSKSSRAFNVRRRCNKYNFMQVPNIIQRMIFAGRGISIMNNVNIRCVQSCQENVFPEQTYEVAGDGIAFSTFATESVFTDFRLNLAALVRLCCHAVRYFHPSARFLNGETASRTFHISDFCRVRSRIVPGISYLRISGHPSGPSNIAIPIKILAN